MRKRICVGLMTLSLLVSAATVSPALAKSVDGMKAQIPFDFYVGDRLAPAGEYTVSALTGDEAVLRICNGRQGNTVLTNSTSERSEGRGHARLVFRKYGDQYFLTAVWGDDKMGRSLRESKRERSLRKEIAAASGGGGDASMMIVTIDAR